MSCRVVSPRGQTHLLFYSYIRIRLVIQHASTYTKKISFVICLASGPLSRSKSNFIRVHNNHFWYIEWPLLVMNCLNWIFSYQDESANKKLASWKRFLLHLFAKFLTYLMFWKIIIYLSYKIGKIGIKAFSNCLLNPFLLLGTSKTRNLGIGNPLHQ